MTPAYCEVCGRCFQNQYFHVQKGGEFVHFADYDDSAVKRGYCPGIVGAAWVCDEHVPLALESARMPMEAAIARLRTSIGSRPFEYVDGLDEPHLFVDEIGPNRGSVFAIVRAATGMTPKQAKDALEHPPVLIAKGWPSSFRNWQEKLSELGASVRIAWD